MVLAACGGLGSQPSYAADSATSPPAPCPLSLCRPAGSAGRQAFTAAWGDPAPASDLSLRGAGAPARLDPAPSRPGESLVYTAGDRAVARYPDQPSFVFPLDLGRQGRADPEFAPFYLPEVYPGLTMQDMAGSDYLAAPGLSQQGTRVANPFQVKQDQVRRLQRDALYRWQRVAQVGALAWLYRHEHLRPESLLDAMTAPSNVATNELLAGATVPTLVKFLPPLLTGVRVDAGQGPVDLAVHTSASVDSVAPAEAMLLAAAKHGSRAVVVVDRGRIDGAQATRAVAEQLMREGRLPADFSVVTGETIQTTAGSVLGLMLRERIPEGMTMRATVREIHRQGGLAYLANPGAPGGKRLLRTHDFEGYLVRPGLPQTFRTSAIMGDPALRGKVPLYASNSLYAAAAGLPYTVLESASSRPDDLGASLAANRAAGVSPLFLPYTVALAYKPLGHFVRALNTFFQAHDLVEESLTRWLGADNVQIVTSWDGEMQDWMGLLRVPGGVASLARGHGPFARLPEILEVAADYGDFRLTYAPRGTEIWLQTAINW